MWIQWSAWGWLTCPGRTQNRITLSETCCPALTTEESRSWGEWWKVCVSFLSTVFQLARLPLVPCSWSWQSTGLGPCETVSLPCHLPLAKHWRPCHSVLTALGMPSFALESASTPNYLTIMTSYRRSHLYFILRSLLLKQICLGVSSPQLDAKPA